MRGQFYALEIPTCNPYPNGNLYTLIYLHRATRGHFYVLEIFTCNTKWNLYTLKNFHRARRG
jgi:hypothetical protein